MVNTKKRGIIWISDNYFHIKFKFLYLININLKTKKNIFFKTTQAFIGGIFRHKV
jgi:hypothetical protein